MKHLFVLSLIMVFILSSFAVYAGVKCAALPNKPPKPAKKVAKEDLKVLNDYDKVVKEDDRDGVVYLALVGGDSPKPNACGLIPSNPAGEWTGWGGPLNCDNCTIGEGATTRNEIVIGGTYFPRGIGVHGAAKYVYDLTGGPAPYARFEGYVGMSDEKDPADCDHGGTSGFTFKLDGKEVFKSKTLAGADGDKNVPPLKVEFDIPATAKKLEISITDGGDGIGCDHSAFGDAKLLTAIAAVESADKLPEAWGKIKVGY